MLKNESEYNKENIRKGKQRKSVVLLLDGNSEMKPWKEKEPEIYCTKEGWGRETKREMEIKRKGGSKRREKMGICLARD